MSSVEKKKEMKKERRENHGYDKITVLKPKRALYYSM